MSRVALIALLLAAAGLAGGCHEDREAERRESARATAAAEQIASEASLTGATVEPRETVAEAERARGEIVAAFQLEQADYRARLERALDALDKDRGNARASGERRALLKTDLDALDRATEQDWATLRTKVDRDLGHGARR